MSNSNYQNLGLFNILGKQITLAWYVFWNEGKNVLFPYGIKQIFLTQNVSFCCFLKQSVLNTI